MAVRIRLRRIGRKKLPAYRLVVADSRSPRDGRFIDIVGHYIPLTDPPVLEVDREKLESWIKKGAKPTDTVRSLLRSVKKNNSSQIESKEKTSAEPVLETVS